MSDTRSYFLPPLAAKPRPVLVNPVRAGGSGYAIAMTGAPTGALTGTLTGSHACGPTISGPKQAGPKPRFTKSTATEATKD